jgi:multiple sugar transport system permease protein
MRGLLRRPWTWTEPRFAYAMLAPMALVTLGLAFFPVAYSLFLSLHQWRLTRPTGPTFIGLANYVRVFNDPLFIASVWKTLYFSFVTVGLTVTLGLAVALLLNRPEVRAKGLFLSIIVVPWAIPNVVGGLMWKWIFDGNYGILNAALVATGITSEYRWWFNESPIVALTMIAVVEVWKNSPFCIVLFLAGLQNVPRNLYRAATMDGATPLQRFRFVTLPNIRLVVLAVLVLQTTWTLKAFDSIYVLTQGGPANNTLVTYFYVFRQAFSYLDMGYASAMAYVVTMAVLLLTLVYYRSLGAQR